MPIRVFGSNSTTTVPVADAVRYAAGYEVNGTQTSDKASVINLSLGATGDPDQLLLEAIEDAVAAGVTVVAASGNEGSGLAGLEIDEIAYPAVYDSVIAVNALNAFQNRASYSHYGEASDFAAPGGVVQDSDGDGDVDDINGDGVPDGILSTWGGGEVYAYLSGTSMAAPHVAAVAALLYAYVPDITPSQVYSVLTESADDLGAAGWDREYGHGLVNASAALEYLVNVGVESPIKPQGSSGGDTGKGATSGSDSKSGLRDTNGGFSAEESPEPTGALLPKSSDSRYQSDSVLVKIKKEGSSELEALAQSGATVSQKLSGGSGVASVRRRGQRLFEVKLTAGTDPVDAIKALSGEAIVQYAQPNYVYTLMD
jgi:subtilisin family serine protease